MVLGLVPQPRWAEAVQAGGHTGSVIAVCATGAQTMATVVARHQHLGLRRQANLGHGSRDRQGFMRARSHTQVAAITVFGIERQTVFINVPGLCGAHVDTMLARGTRYACVSAPVSIDVQLT